MEVGRRSTTELPENRVDDNGTMATGDAGRRALLKKLGIAAGALAWATPTVQTIATAVAGAQEKTGCHDISHLDLVVMKSGQGPYGIQWDPGEGWSKHSTSSKHCLAGYTWTQPSDSLLSGLPTPTAKSGGSYELTLPSGWSIVSQGGQLLAFSKAGTQCQRVVSLGGSSYRFDKWCAGGTTTTTLATTTTTRPTTTTSSTTTTRPPSTTTTQPTTTTTLSGGECDDDVAKSDPQTYEVTFGEKTYNTTTTRRATTTTRAPSTTTTTRPPSTTTTTTGGGSTFPGNKLSASGSCREQWWDASGKVGAWVAAATFTYTHNRHAFLTVEVTKTKVNNTTSVSTTSNFYVPANGSATLEVFDNQYSSPAASSDIKSVKFKVTSVKTYNDSWVESTYSVSAPLVTSACTPTSGGTTTTTRPPTTTTTTTRPPSTTTTTTRPPSTTTTLAGGGDDCGSPGPGKDISHMDWIISRPGTDRYGVQYDFGSGWGAHPSSNTSSQHCLAGLSWRVPPGTFSFSGFGNAVTLGGGAYRITLPADVTVHDAFSKCGQTCRRATHLGGNTWRFDPC